MRHDPDALMIFAAGFGTRMAPLTDTVPKPLLTVGDKSLLEHALACRAGVDIKRTVVNAHYKAEMVAEAVEGRDVQVSVEEDQILDTGGGLKAALPLLASDAVYTLNSDMVWLGPNPLAVLREAWHTTDADALALVVPMAATHMRKPPGDFSLDADHRISRGGDYVYTGAQILKTRLVENIGQDVFSLNLIWDALMGAGEFKAAVYPGEWCDVGTPDGLARANTLWAEKNSV